MSKYDFEPQKVNIIFVIVLCCTTFYCSFMGAYVKHENSNIWSNLTTTSITISTVYLHYCVFSIVQFLWSLLDLSKSKKKSRVEKSTTQVAATSESCIKYQLQSMLLRSFDFKQEKNYPKLYISREDMWRISYPFAFGTFFLFLCIPNYDASCSIMMSCGFFSYAVYCETVRGRLWKRPTHRTIGFVFVVLTGAISILSIFILAVNHGLHLTEKGRNETTYLKNTKFIPLDWFFSNISNLEYGENNWSWFDNGSNNSMVSTSNTSTNDNTNIADLGDVIEHGKNTYYQNNAMYAQYWSWGMNSYFTKMFVPWIASYCVPFMLKTAPLCLSIQTTMEICQPSLQAITGFVVFLISRHTNTAPLALYTSKGVISGFYILTAGFCIWISIFAVCHFTTRKKTNTVCYILLTTTVIQLSLVLCPGEYDHVLLVFIYCITGTYLLLSIWMDMDENLHIRKGWVKEEFDDLHSVTSMLSDVDPQTAFMLDNTEVDDEGMQMQDVDKEFPTTTKEEGNA